MTEPDLRHHGDREATPGLVDLAVNVRWSAPPGWLREALAATLDGLGRYPDPAAAAAAVAHRFGRRTEEVLLTAGAAEAFVLLARALRPRHAVVVHPQFTEPEAALRAAGHTVARCVLRPESGFALDPAAVPESADLVLLGNPTNPTGTLHPADAVAALVRPGRLVVVDEAFMDFVPRETESLAGLGDLTGLVVIRSLTKMWGLAGLRVGYLLAEAPVVRRLSAAQPLWAVSTPALAAVVACSDSEAVAAAQKAAAKTARARADLVAVLGGVPGLHLAGDPAANFVLARAGGRPDCHGALRQRGFAVRRGDTFPGLGPEWLRIAVRDAPTHRALAEALRTVLA